ncbi:MAG: hypothetical protein WBG30_07765 [Psychrilyobacter sp.]|uniref:hypothetical protein n=1 Tax=Psychrilyobacter sp. TaxID=2586924 RepID=UPI003C795F67
MKKFFYILFLLLLSINSFAEDGVFYIKGQAVKAISLALGVKSIDFGDVFPDAEIDPVFVGLYVNAEAGYDYQIKISNDDSSGILQISRDSLGGYTGNTITYKNTGIGTSKADKFYVGLDTRNIKSDLSATITVTVIYCDIF